MSDLHPTLWSDCGFADGFWDTGRYYIAFYILGRTPYMAVFYMPEYIEQLDQLITGSYTADLYFLEHIAPKMHDGEGVGKEQLATVMPLELCIPLITDDSTIPISLREGNASHILGRDLKERMRAEKVIP
jgi:hypothetical protein